MRLAILALLIGIAGYVGYKLIEDPSDQLFGQTLVSGPASQRIVALTYDDGPNPPYTDRILKVLQTERIRATFFVVGRAVVAHPATVRALAQAGEVIGNHTWDHEHLIVHTPGQERAELARTDAAVYRITGQHLHFMRPPFGARDFAVIDEAKRDGYTVVMWSVPLANDWDRPGAAVIAQRIVAHVRPGSIIVLHDGNRGIVCGGPVPPLDCDRSQDVAATRMIVDTLRKRGYRFVTIPELLHDARIARRDPAHR
ncbi:MAG: polysaccharide deacetylase family protein [Vulcanimicrobiaceae bacterium]